MPFFLISAATFFILVRFTAGDSIPAYYILMFLCGFFLGGPFNIISSAIAADLGRNPAIRGIA
jgi:sugar phosphate permease